jgi:hypothetical protein
VSNAHSDRAVSLTLMPADWRAWLLQSVERGSKPADLLRQLTAQGHLTVHAALRAIDEALAATTKPRAAPVRLDARPWLNTDQRLLDALGRPVSVRAALTNPGVAVLDNLLDDTECALLCAVAAGRSRPKIPCHATAAMAWPMRADAGTPPAPIHPVIDLLAARLSALVNWPLAHFQPLQIRRLHSGEACRPRSQHGGRPGCGDGGPVVGSFVVYLDAPARGGATCLPGAMGLRVLPHAGTAIWFDHQWPGGAGATALQAAIEPTDAEPPWVVTAWLHAQVWRQTEPA